MQPGRRSPGSADDGSGLQILRERGGLRFQHGDGALHQLRQQRHSLISQQGRKQGLQLSRSRFNCIAEGKACFAERQGSAAPIWIAAHHDQVSYLELLNDARQGARVIAKRTGKLRERCPLVGSQSGEDQPLGNGQVFPREFDFLGIPQCPFQSVSQQQKLAVGVRVDFLLVRCISNQRKGDVIM